MQDLSISLIQTPIHWEQKQQNLDALTHKIRSLDGATDLVVLPEMFTTGFTMEPAPVAEPMDGKTVGWMRRMAEDGQCVITGSLIIVEDGHYYNRLIWMQPDGSHSFYDKWHLFRFAGEHKSYRSGKEKRIVGLKGWKIMLTTCYDLRFPVWNRNKYDPQIGFDYDCIVNVANWPEGRNHAWRVLLMARAIENQCYVAGVNRVGRDGNGMDYSGDSAVIGPQGVSLSHIRPSAEQVETVRISRRELADFRDSFRVWGDWDRFQMDS